jgi:flagellar hook assembly protein FlgD
VETPALTLALEQNLPNPFNPATTIPFVLEAASRVVLRVYDVRGALVATLYDGVLPEGRHTIGWDGRNDHGRTVSSGTYLYSLVAGNRHLSRKMLMVR